MANMGIKWVQKVKTGHLNSAPIFGSFVLAHATSQHVRLLWVYSNHGDYDTYCILLSISYHWECCLEHGWMLSHTVTKDSGPSKISRCPKICFQSPETRLNPHLEIHRSRLPNVKQRFDLANSRSILRQCSSIPAYHTSDMFAFYVSRKTSNMYNVLKLY